MRISCSVRSKAVQFQIIELMANVVQARHLLVEKSNGELTANVPPIGFSALVTYQRWRCRVCC